MKQSSSWFFSSSLVAAWTSPICSFAGCFDKRALPGRERPALPEYALIPTRNQGTNKNRCRGSSFGRHLPLTQVGLCSDGQLSITLSLERSFLATNGRLNPPAGPDICQRKGSTLFTRDQNIAVRQNQRQELKSASANS